MHLIAISLPIPFHRKRPHPRRQRQFGRLPAVQDRLDDHWRKQGQAQKPFDLVGFEWEKVDLFGVSRYKLR